MSVRNGNSFENRIQSQRSDSFQNPHILVESDRENLGEKNIMLLRVSKRISRHPRLVRTFASEQEMRKKIESTTNLEKITKS